MASLLIICSLWEASLIRKIVTDLRLLLKLGLAPCHFWLPHVYSGQSFTAILIMATFIKTPGLRLTYQLMDYIILVAAGFRAILGGVAGITTRSIKKMLAFSGISHRG